MASNRFIWTRAFGRPSINAGLCFRKIHQKPLSSLKIIHTVPRKSVNSTFASIFFSESNLTYVDVTEIRHPDRINAEKSQSENARRRNARRQWWSCDCPLLAVGTVSKMSRNTGWHFERASVRWQKWSKFLQIWAEQRLERWKVVNSIHYTDLYCIITLYGQYSRVLICSSACPNHLQTPMGWLTIMLFWDYTTQPSLVKDSDPCDPQNEDVVVLASHVKSGSAQFSHLCLAKAAQVAKQPASFALSWYGPTGIIGRKRTLMHTLWILDMSTVNSAHSHAMAMTHWLVTQWLKTNGSNMSNSCPVSSVSE